MTRCLTSATIDIFHHSTPERLMQDADPFAQGHPDQFPVSYARTSALSRHVPKDALQLLAKIIDVDAWTMIGRCPVIMAFSLRSDSHVLLTMAAFTSPPSLNITSWYMDEESHFVLKDHYAGVDLAGERALNQLLGLAKVEHWPGDWGVWAPARLRWCGLVVSSQ